MKLFALGKLREAVQQATGLDITHVYEDLVFVEHSPFLIRFDHDDLTKVYAHFNIDCDTEDKEKLLGRLVDTASMEGLNCVDAARFTLEPVDGKEEIRINFLPN